jgi:hypothetical protein
VGWHSYNDKRGFVRHVLPALLYTVLIFWLGSIHTGLSVPQDMLPSDKVNHFAAFGLLAWLVLRALRFEYQQTSANRLIVGAIAVSSVVGALLEAWQSLFPYRKAELGDWVADTVGAALVGLIGLFWLRWRERPMAAG